MKEDVKAGMFVGFIMGVIILDCLFHIFGVIK